MTKREVQPGDELKCAECGHQHWSGFEYLICPVCGCAGQRYCPKCSAVVTGAHCGACGFISDWYETRFAIRSVAEKDDEDHPLFWSNDEG